MFYLPRGDNMRFLTILWQWFDNTKPDPDSKEVKKASIKFLTIENIIVAIIFFFTGIKYTLDYPDIAESLWNLYQSIFSVFG